MDELQALIKELRELIATLKAVPQVNASGSVAPAVVDLPYPRDVEIDGAKFHLFRPINPKWKTSQYARMFSGGGHVMDDPSLATTPDGYPSRSPAGYPLIYPFVKDGKPYKPAVILFGENTFPDDAAVEAYIVSTTPTAEDMERARKQWEEYDAALKKRAQEATSGVTTPSAPPSNRQGGRHGATVTPTDTTTDGVYVV